MAAVERDLQVRTPAGRERSWTWPPAWAWTPRAAQIFDGNEYAGEVRVAEQQWQRAGIHAVPAIVVDRRHLIEGAQPPEVFEEGVEADRGGPVAVSVGAPGRQEDRSMSRDRTLGGLAAVACRP
ncbi:MAG: hypothetical protein U1F67_24415 [Rubrivivax sp.]